MKKAGSGRTDNAKKPSESQEQYASPEDLPCIRCGYNVRELSPDGRCPECGTPIHRSIHGDLLSVADSAWLTRVSRGLTLVYAALVTCVATIVPWFFFDDWLVLSFLLGAILLLLGILGLTTPDPRLTLTEQPVALRRIVRGPAIAGLLIGLLLVGLKLLETAGGGVDPLVGRVAPWTFWGTLAFTWVAAGFYLARLGERIPEMELAKQTRSLARGFAVCLVLYISLGITGLGLSEVSFEDNLIASFLAVIFGLAFFVGVAFTILFMRAWFKYRKPIKRCLLEARKMGAS